MFSTPDQSYTMYGYTPIPKYAMEQPVRISHSELQVPPPYGDT